MILLFATLCLHATETAPGKELRFWVWHRSTALSSRECAELKDAGVSTVYWHALTMRAAGKRWIPVGDTQLPMRQTGELAVVPVVRLSTGPDSPLGAIAAESVVAVLKHTMGKTGARMVQIDFDCPDRRLGEYARFLQLCRSRIAPAELSVTALAGWTGSRAFGELQAACDELVPMFYDLEPDRPEAIRAGHVLPIASAEIIRRQLRSWRACRTRWFAGLPNFARITIFDGEGRSRGHLRSWTWDEIVFAPDLLNWPGGSAGVSLLTSARDTVIADTPVRVGELIACRRPDLDEMSQVVASAAGSGAAGIAMFRLPGEGAQSAWSLAQIGELNKGSDASTPRLELKRTAAGLTLVNASRADLPPRLRGSGDPHDRGWQVELEVVSGAMFREASPGEFAAVYGHIDPEAAQPTRVPLPLAERLTYWFSELRAGASRQSGLLQLAPGASLDQLRWRIPGSPHNAEWQLIE